MSLAETAQSHSLNSITLEDEIPLTETSQSPQGLKCMSWR